MKYIIPENKIVKIVFRYLDNTLKNLEKRKSEYVEGIALVYPDEEDEILMWETDGTLYIDKELIDEISNWFALKDSDSKSIIVKWFSNRYQLEVKNIFDDDDDDE
jgi:hypothetical protein